MVHQTLVMCIYHALVHNLLRSTFPYNFVLLMTIYCYTHNSIQFRVMEEE